MAAAVVLKNGWVYYCCGQGYKVSNRFIAMPAWRNRILGVQLYKYKMEVFLHWGYNFSYSSTWLKASITGRSPICRRTISRAFL